MLVVAVLLEDVGSLTAEPTVMELTITVPGAVPPVTRKTNVNIELALAAMDGLLQETVVAPTTQVQPGGTMSSAKVVFAGMVSTAVTVVAVAGPLLVTTAMWVILAPARTGLGESVMVTAISAWLAAATVTFAVALLFELLESETVDEPMSVSVITVPVVVPAFTAVTSVKLAVVPEVTEAIVQVTMPVPPTAGVEQLQEAGFVMD